jgi:2-polyprenyl-3-methyl-5-hydroxy-6-metoxy-1,4-benzoquinol methylase
VPCCCSHCDGIEREFDDSTAKSDLKRYLRRGPLPTTHHLLDALQRLGIGGATLLDIGGGIGSIHHELLASGAERAVHVDASSAYLATARDEARRRGHEGRVQFRHGDFTELAPAIEPADIVTLDRVICCYPDMERLVELSAARARRLYGLVFPREVPWVRAMVPVANLWFRVRGCGFRVYLHSGHRVEAVVAGQGLRRVFRRTTPLWQVLVYAR